LLKRRVELRDVAVDLSDHLLVNLEPGWFGGPSLCSSTLCSVTSMERGLVGSLMIWIRVFPVATMLPSNFVARSTILWACSAISPEPSAADVTFSRAAWARRTACTPSSAFW
jgi:hypothetical protein